MSEVIRKLASGGPIRAYHGSPYNFDKFDASKIGTGEGKASHGLGFYATKSKELAEYYRPKGGLVYELEIPEAEENLLNWNRPVIEQSGRVQDAVRELLSRDALQMKGGRAYDEIAKHYGDGLSDLRASELLLERGIMGNTHLGARQGEATRPSNYVIFPGAADNIRILRKYGAMAPVAAGAASQQEQKR